VAAVLGTFPPGNKEGARGDLNPVKPPLIFVTLKKSFFVIYDILLFKN